MNITEEQSGNLKYKTCANYDGEDESPLHNPNNYSLDVVLRELKKGRNIEDRDLLNDFIEKIRKYK